MSPSANERPDYLPAGSFASLGTRTVPCTASPVVESDYGGRGPTAGAPCA